MSRSNSIQGTDFPFKPAVAWWLLLGFVLLLVVVCSVALPVEQGTVCDWREDALVCETTKEYLVYSERRVSEPARAGQQLDAHRFPAERGRGEGCGLRLDGKDFFGWVPCGREGKYVAALNAMLRDNPSDTRFEDVSYARWSLFWIPLLPLGLVCLLAYFFSVRRLVVTVDHAGGVLWVRRQYLWPRPASHRSFPLREITGLTTRVAGLSGQLLLEDAAGNVTHIMGLHGRGVMERAVALVDHVNEAIGGRS